MALRIRLGLVTLVALCCVALAAPAGAGASARADRDRARARQAQAAAQLNTLRATDRELQAAMAALDGQVRGQEAALTSARQALDAARRARAEADAQAAATERQIGRLRGVVVSRAVQAYMRPRAGTALTDIVDAQSLDAAARRQLLLERVTGNDQEAIDALRSAREDLQVEQDRAARAATVADRRRASVDARLRTLRTARDGQARLAAAVQDRIRVYQAEADSAAAEEGRLSALIRSQEAAARARAAAGVDPGFDPAAAAVSGSGLIWPVNGRVTSEFGPRWGRQHAGIDIAAPTGTPIRAAKGGTVIYSGDMGGYGYAIVIDHGGGFSTLYAHQSRLVAPEGAQVAQGELIGYVGSTGHSTGPHCHFETRVNGEPQNPRRYLP